MEYIIILVICILAILTLKYAMGVKIKDLKKIKEIGYDKNLNEITNKLPSNKEVCKQILESLNNKDVIIQESEDKESKLTYYMVLTNHIIIANINDTFSRIQTIAHECLHSVQNKQTLMFNFIFSNIYLIYFFGISILTILKQIPQPMVALIGLIIIGIIHYVVRSYLETDAMTKAPYVAKEYIEKTNQLSNEELETIMKNYHELNKIGIPLTNFQLITSVIIKVVIYTVIAMIITMI